MNTGYQAVSKNADMQHRKPEVRYLRLSQEQLLTPPLGCNQLREHSYPVSEESQAD